MWNLPLGREVWDRRILQNTWWDWAIWNYYLSERRMSALTFLSLCQGEEHFDYVHKAKRYTPAVASLDEYICRRQHCMQDRVSLALTSWTDLRGVFTGKVRLFRKLETIILLLYLSVDLLVSWFAVVSVPYLCLPSHSWPQWLRI